MTADRECCLVCPYEDECGNMRFRNCKVRKRYDEDPQEWRSGYNEYIEQGDNTFAASLGD